MLFDNGESLILATRNWKFSTLSAPRATVTIWREPHGRNRSDGEGNRGEGTAGYKAYGREHEIACPGKPPLRGSADPLFRGDAALHNPEDLLVAALSACHMLWYLHLCSVAGVVVTAYEDAAEGTMETRPPEGSGAFTRVTLRPRVTVTAAS